MSARGTSRGARAVALLGALSVGVAQAQAQNVRCNIGAGPGPFGADTMSAAAVAESLVVLDQVERYLRSNPGDPAAWHRRAMVAWAVSASPVERAKQEAVEYTRMRQKADLSFQEATRLNPPSVQALIDAGNYYMSSAWTVTRAAARGYFTEALRVARETGDSTLVAQAMTEVAKMYRRLAQATPGPDKLDELRARQYAADAFRIAPEATESFRFLSTLLVEDRRWTELEAVAQERIARVPDDGFAWMTIGLSQMERRGARAARASFATGLALLPPAERARLDRSDRVMRTRDSVHLASLEPDERARVEQVAWSRADPLWSQAEEEPRIEFLARVTFAELRWTVPERGARGADTDEGRMYIRYGPRGLRAAPRPYAPVRGAGVEASGASILGSQAAFARPSPVSFTGTQPPLAGMVTPSLSVAPAPESGDGEASAAAAGGGFGLGGFYGNRCFLDSAAARRAFDARPHDWSNIAYVRLDSMPVQVARFRATPDSVDVFVAAHAPVRAIRQALGVDVRVGAHLWLYGDNTPDSLHESASLTDDVTLQWLRRVSAGRYYYRIEATAPGALRAARAAALRELGPDPLSGFTMSGFGMSDVVLASRVTAPTDARRFTDTQVLSVLGGAVRAGDVSLLWENYEISRTGTAAQYDVAIHVEPNEQRAAQSAATRIVARIVGGLASAAGVSTREDGDRIMIEFAREVPHAPVLLDNVTLSLEGTPPGRYALTVVVTDRATGRVTSRSMTIQVRP